MHGDVAALRDASVTTDSGTRRLQVLLEKTRGGKEAARRVLGIDSGLDRPAVDPRSLAAIETRLTRAVAGNQALGRGKKEGKKEGVF